MAVKVSEKLRKELCQIDDSCCLLLEFPNEENQLSVGFAAWVKGKVYIAHAIEKGLELEIYWPIDIPVNSSSLLKPHLGSANFEKRVAVVKESGEWTALRKSLKSLITNGKLDVSKRSRHTFKQKKSTTSEEPVKKKKSTSGRPIKKKKKVNQKVQIQKNRLLLAQLQNREKFQLPHPELSDPELSDPELSDPELSDTKLSDPKLSDPQLSDLSDDSNTKLDKKLENFGTVSTPKSYLRRTGYDLKGTESNSSSKSLLGEKNSENGIDLNDSLDSEAKDEEVESLQGEAESKKSVNHRKANTDAVTIQDGKKDDEAKLPAGVLIEFPLTQRKISIIQKKSVQSLVSGLCDNFFSLQYLADHSPTGKITNANKKLIPKPALHPPTVQYIRECVRDHFGGSKKLYAMVTKALSDKISAARTALRGKPKANKNKVE